MSFWISPKSSMAKFSVGESIAWNLLHLKSEMYILPSIIRPYHYFPHIFRKKKKTIKNRHTMHVCIEKSMIDCSFGIVLSPDSDKIHQAWEILLWIYRVMSTKIWIGGPICVICVSMIYFKSFSIFQSVCAQFMVRYGFMSMQLFFPICWCIFES